MVRVVGNETEALLCFFHGEIKNEVEYCTDCSTFY